MICLAKSRTSGNLSLCIEPDASNTKTMSAAPSQPVDDKTMSGDNIKNIFELFFKNFLTIVSN